MPKPRRQLVDLAVTPFYHCISRVVRRAFLCGSDPLTRQNFDHRRRWIADRMKKLVEIFAIDVCSYGLMSNHFHLILHVDRSRAKSWTHDEVSQRYEQLFPQTVRTARQLPPRAWNKRVRCWHKRLSDLSWFMRCLNEFIAREANREDNCTGRFWEGRFRSQALLDPGALLTCMAYVDLNPIRAGLATKLEDAQFTSIQERLLSAARKETAVPGLMPFADQGAPEEAKLPVRFDDYEQIVRFAMESIRSKTRVEIPAEVKVTLEGYGLEGENFVDTLRHYSRSFFTMVGAVHRFEVESQRRGYKRQPGIRAARKLYRSTG